MGAADAPLVSGHAIAVVVIVIALLAAAAWFLRKTAGARRSRQAVAVETAVSLGERRSLVIVSVEGRRLLLGLTPASVSLVTELQATFGTTLDATIGAGERS
jgi:flagellar protein FliO/FliZ